MNRRKLIYFLSAFVLIIGCYTLNLSYSLFTQNITSENNVVDSTIPILNASLEEDTFTIPTNSEKLIKLKIINSGTADIQYGITITDTKGTIVQLVEGNNIIGTLDAPDSEGENTKTEVWVYVTNPTETEVSNLTFGLISKYNTVTFDYNEFINSSNFKKKEDGTLDTVKLLNSSVINKAMDTTITDEEKTIYDDSFDSNNITNVSGENERKLIKAEDDYGTSYVFRGVVKDNYVNFAGFTWRIVRINGDGSIRLILDGTLDKTCVEYNEDNTCKTYAGTTSAFNSVANDNAYVGYMYGFTGGVTNKCLTKDATTKEYTVDSSTTYTTKETCESAGGRWAATAYETTHINKNSSTIKTNIDTFYETYIENGTTKQFEKYLADTMFCGDKSVATSNIGYNNKATGYGTGSINETYYAATERLYYSSGTTDITTAEPTLKCAENANNNYSRYTVEEQNRNNVLTNGDLKHPIALLSADELVMAGAWNGKANQGYYLYDSYENETSNWWSLSPYSFDGSYAREFNSYAASNSLINFDVNGPNGSRPVINLRSDVLIESGDGTKKITYDEEGNILTEGPYIIN